MSMYAPFPEHILREIRHYPGNQKCCDCSSLDTDWGNVNHGTLICLDCAGKHRALGVHVSFIRSLYMDTWNENQVAMMRYGGNGQIRDFFKKLKIENSSIDVLYMTKGATLYRERLKERVEKILSGEIVVDPPRQLASHPSLEFTHPSSEVISPQSGEKTSIHECVFESGPMGITLTKDYRGSANVSRVVAGGAGSSKGVEINDIVIGIMGKSITEYDEVMHMILCMERPIRLAFSRVVKPAHSLMKTSSSVELNRHGHKTPSPTSLTTNSSTKSEPAFLVRNGIVTKVNSPHTFKNSNSKVVGKAIQSTMKDDSSDSDIDFTINQSLFEKSKLRKSRNSKTSTTSAGNTNDDLSKNDISNNVSPKSESSEGSTFHSSSIKLEVQQHTDTHTDPSDTCDIHNKDDIIIQNEKRSVVTESLRPSSSIDEIDSDKVSDDTLISKDVVNHTSSNSNINSNNNDDNDDNDDDNNDDVRDINSSNDSNGEYQQRDNTKELVTEVNGKESLETIDDDSFEMVESNVDMDKECIHNSNGEQSQEEELDDDGDDANDDEDDNNDNDDVNNEEDDGDDDDDDDDDEQDDEPLSMYLQRGMEVKAFRKNKWRTAIIKKIHGDGSFKVAYKKDGHSESHVSVDRIGLTPKTLQDIEMLMLAKRSQSNESNESSESTIQSDMNNDSPLVEPKFTNMTISDNYTISSRPIAIIEDDEEFIVAPEESLDDWIEDDNSLISQIQAVLGQNNKESETEPSISNAREFIARFKQPPLGLTLARGKNGSAEVVKVKSDGQASSLGVMVGDIVVGIDTVKVVGYDDAMPLLARSQYPLILILQRGAIHLLLHKTGDAVIKGSKMISSTIMDSVGMNKRSIMEEPSQERLSNRSGERRTGNKPESSTTDTKSNKMSTKRMLSEIPSESWEYDVIFEEGDLGLRLEEKVIGGGVTASVVTNLTDKSQAVLKRVQLESHIVGVNGEPYISHAHTIACLKHSKRPIKVRFGKRR